MSENPLLAEAEALCGISAGADPGPVPEDNADVAVFPARTDGERLIVSFAEFAAEADEPVTSLWGDALVVAGGGYTIVGGDGGVGKTIMLTNLLLAAAAGRADFLGFSLPGRTVSVLILEAEGSRTLFRKRMVSVAHALGLPLEELPIAFHRRTARLWIDEDTLPTMIEQARAEIVLLDPIGRFHEGEENSASDWKKRVVRPLDALAKTYGCAFAFTDHYTKPSETRQGRHRLRGTSAKHDDAGCALRLEVGRGGKSSRVLFFDRVRDGGLPDPDRLALAIDVTAGTIDLDPEGASLGGPDELPAASVRAVAVPEILRDHGAPMRSAEIVAALGAKYGVAKTQASDVLALAHATKLIERESRGVYRLPGAVLP